MWITIIKNSIVNILPKFSIYVENITSKSTVKQDLPIKYNVVLFKNLF